MTDDLISRQQAIVAIEQHRIAVLEGHKWDEGIEYGYAAAHRHLVDIIEQLPSIQSERKIGQWIQLTCDSAEWWYCSECNGRVQMNPWAKYNYCPNCGANMRGEQNE